MKINNIDGSHKFTVLTAHPYLMDFEVHLSFHQVNIRCIHPKSLMLCLFDGKSNQNQNLIDRMSQPQEIKIILEKKNIEDDGNRLSFNKCLALVNTNPEINLGPNLVMGRQTFQLDTFFPFLISRQQSFYIIFLQQLTHLLRTTSRKKRQKDMIFSPQNSSH